MPGFRLCAELGEKGKPDAREAMVSIHLEPRRLNSKMWMQLPLPQPALEITALLPCPFFIEGCTDTQNKTQTNKLKE